MTTEIQPAVPGIRFNGSGEVTVHVWAPEKKKVEVCLENGKSWELSPAEPGCWSVVTDGIRSGDLYRFRLDGKLSPDPASVSQPEGVHGPSQALDLNRFQWSDAGWKNVVLQDYIIYELHTGTFTPEGTFAGIEQKLDYLVELGINAIEIMPVSQFAGGRNWGYDGVFPYAVHDTYGGPEGLQHLVDACHQKGIAVILDVVYNHIGPEGNVLGEYGPYFTDKYHTPWGNAVNVDDEWSDGVREYFIQNALMWFREFHIDALRLDAVHAIKDFSPKHLLAEMKERVDALAAETGSVHYLITEMDLNDTRFISPIEKGGYGMDAQWIDEFHHALRVASGQSKTGYYSDFEPITSLAKSYQDAYVFDGQYSDHRKRKFGIKAEGFPGSSFIVFSQNHDQVGNRMLGERTSELLSWEMQKLLAGAVMVSPFLPMLFMGEEWSEPHPFQYFVSHTDPELAEAVRTGRKKEFAAFHLEGEAPDPMSEDTFNGSRLQWELVNQEPHKSMFEYYKELIALRKSNPALHTPDRSLVRVYADEARQLIWLTRSANGQNVLAILNFSDQQQEVAGPDNIKEMVKLIGSADEKWRGPLNGDEQSTPDKIRVSPESFTLFSYSA
ncbi:malto-oligosyltrehalose trehalohydrolase [Dyadobacter sandarakinus]|uniref:Malto-oligosyltrehalose trehalohydrolase n=1 Tax=Dyadobacter sandarakinus TaxID=2747268 RepID=A0ABX7I1M7_9BACT|nr:malto-oligosyltrehalose trehalohydrolase [Dyadobacter sandarakinus]QRQ99948.1 malto-oligosyltrehalose trehalohydrolase [Dyadobacter sandarakinus]